MQPQTPGQPPTPTPWWIPTDSDTSELYAQWYDPAYKGAATASVAAPATSVKNKNKNFYKRKNEFIDPAQDAGDLENRVLENLSEDVINVKVNGKRIVNIQILISLCLFLRKSSECAEGTVGADETAQM